MPNITNDFDPDRFPKIDYKTGRVTDPEKWTQQEVAWATNINAGQFGLLNMSDYQLHQASRYDSDKQNILGAKMIEMGYDNANTQKMVAMTPEHMYYRLRKKQLQGFHE